MTTQHWNKTRFSIALLVALLGLAACGGRSTVVTQDDSAAYRNAQSLPPLKKPNAPENQLPQTVVSQAEPAPQTSVAAPAPQPDRAESRAINARVVESDDGQVVLEIEAGADAAWRYLRTNLKRSDITVHTRNKAAGRFAIGCAGVDADAEVTVTKSGGWSIFKRRQSETEHCSLQMVADNQQSVVRAYDRSGQPVPASSARSLFSRLLNN